MIYYDVHGFDNVFMGPNHNTSTEEMKNLYPKTNLNWFEAITLNC